MRKTVLLTIMAAALLALMGVGLAAAQDDKMPIEIGEYVEGKITNKNYEFKYTFEGKKGDVISVEMMPTVDDYSLDPYLILRDSDGDVLAENDDFGYPLSLVVVELPANETYTVLATRNSGSTGESEGGFRLRVNKVELVTSGTKLEATITTDYENATPNFYIIRPEKSGSVTVAMSQDVNELFAALKVSTWDPDYGGELIVAELGNTARISKASLVLDLDSDQFYVIRVERSYSSYAYDIDEATVLVTVD